MIASRRPTGVMPQTPSKQHPRFQQLPVPDNVMTSHNSEIQGNCRCGADKCHKVAVVPGGQCSCSAICNDGHEAQRSYPNSAMTDAGRAPDPTGGTIFNLNCAGLVAWQRRDHGVFAWEVTAMAICRMDMTGKNLKENKRDSYLLALERNIPFAFGLNLPPD